MPLWALILKLVCNYSLITSYLVRNPFFRRVAFVDLLFLYVLVFFHFCSKDELLH